MNIYEKKFKDKTGQNFNKYYKQYKPKLTWYLTKYTKNIEIAEEFANMAFVQGLEKIDSYNNNLSQFITWLTSIAINLVIKDYKDRKKQNLTSLDEELCENFTLTSLLSRDFDDIKEKEKTNENIFKSNKIKEVIYNLPDKYKEVMIMRELENKPYKEISNSIFKEKILTITNDIFLINIDEYFYSLNIKNIGDMDIIINYKNSDYIINPFPKNEKLITKNDIKNISEIKIISYNSITNLKLIETTNLSTIKSQIKKGRFLIRKKVKKEFELIDKNGIE